MLAEGANRWRLLAEQGRRLRVRPSQSGLRGPRETPPGPTTWVRPATDWWKRMNAGESPPNQGRSVKGAPVRFQKAVSRSKENASGAPRGAPVRVMDRQLPPAGGTGPIARRANGSAIRPATFGAPLPSILRLRRVRNQQFERKPAGMCRAAALPHGSTTHGWRRNRCRSLCRCLSAVMPALVAGIHALLRDKGRRGWPEQVRP